MTMLLCCFSSALNKGNPSYYDLASYCHATSNSGDVHNCYCAGTEVKRDSPSNALSQNIKINLLLFLLLVLKESCVCSGYSTKRQRLRVRGQQLSQARLSNMKVPFLILFLIFWYYFFCFDTFYINTVF